jgi:hypothetical protein
MLDPEVFHVIRDVPGDCVVFDDTYMQTIGEIRVLEVFWRSSSYNRHDIRIPDPYAPIDDWKPYHPHNMLFVPGYDWEKDFPGWPGYHLIVNNKPFEPKFDFEADEIKTIGFIDGIISGYRMNRPPDKVYQQRVNPYDETEFDENDPITKERLDRRIEYDNPDIRTVNTLKPRFIDFERFDMPVMTEAFDVIHERRN